MSEFWPGGARLAVSLSTMFEGTGQPVTGAAGPITEPIEGGVPDLPTNSFFEYGMREGVPRLLDLWDELGIPVSVFMIGQAVAGFPGLAREVADRGHEVAAHGWTWTPQYHLPEEQERRTIADDVAAIEGATGRRPLGYNCYWLRRSTRTLDLLAEQGLRYHIDDVALDEPFTRPLSSGEPFCVVPYTLHLNDIVSFNWPGYSPAAHLQVLRDEFDELYAEGARRRRLMVVSTHDRISGRPNRMRVLREFVRYAQGHEGVWFARKDEIAAHALATPDLTPALPAERGLADPPE